MTSKIQFPEDDGLTLKECFQKPGLYRSGGSLLVVGDKTGLLLVPDLEPEFVTPKTVDSATWAPFSGDVVVTFSSHY